MHHVADQRRTITARFSSAEIAMLSETAQKLGIKRSELIVQGAIKEAQRRNSTISTTAVSPKATPHL